MKPLVTMRAALADALLFGAVLEGDSWATWRVLLIAAMGEELTDAERGIWKAVTGREREPGVLCEELWAIVGRRGGKTRAIAVLGSYLAALCDHTDILAPGERGSLPIMSATTTQAAKAFSYLRGVFQHSPMLGQLVDSETTDTIRLTNRVDIEIKPASYRTIRGATAVAAIGDEAAFWSGETTVNPDTEILNAIRPAMATTGGPLIVISSPYARKGELWSTFRQHYGPDGDPRVIVAKGPSRTFNPSLPQSVVDRAFQRDPVAAAAEYGAEFRSDVEAFLSRDVVDAVTMAGRHELPPSRQFNYVGFVDPSGGSADSFTLAIAHREGEAAVLDVVREVRPPFSPDSVVAEFASLLATYSITSVRGDRYGGEWPRERFRTHGIAYEPSDRTRSELYGELLPILNAGRAELLDVPKIANQLIGLERRTSRVGRDTIDHAPGAHDDLANAVAGALVFAIDGSGFDAQVWLRAFDIQPETSNG